MGRSLATAEVRTHPNPLRNDLESVRGKDAKIRMDSEPVRTTSERVRIDPNLTDKAAFLALVDECRIACDMSVKEMAINASVPESQMSEALKGVPGRGNFAGHWLYCQPERFLAKFCDLVLTKRGIDKARRAQIRGQQIGQLVALLVESTVVDK